MLIHLGVHNYTLVDNLDLELHPGLTTLTGETGAGKSLLLDAIGLALGNKVSSDAILNNELNAEVSALFDINQHTHIQQWLEKNELPIEGQECILKRVITPQGRSRCFINGRTVALTQLQELGHKLVNIHGQHEHQALLNTSTQRRLLDNYGNYPALTNAVSSSFVEWKNTKQQLEQAKNIADAQGAQYQLLKYQVEELNLLDLKESEAENLEKLQKRIANSQSIQLACGNVVEVGRDSDQSIQFLLNKSIQQLMPMAKNEKPINEAIGMLQTALINVEEAISTVEYHLEQLSNEELDLSEIEQRLSAIYNVARKHKVKPLQLFEHQQSLIAEFQALSSSDEHINHLEIQTAKYLEAYETHSNELQNARKKSAAQLTKEINQRLALLNMESAEFVIELTPTDTPTPHGNHTINFLISTIPGKPAGPLNKIASGGELSRIGLAIQVVTAASHTTPTLIFDEVDTGIGGTTGDIVGQLLRELGSQTQVMCVTHLAQVASKAHNHLNVIKQTQNGSVRSQILPLMGNDVVKEIARMVGGPTNTETSLAHARQMIESL